jgi:hypothetical protein
MWQGSMLEAMSDRRTALRTFFSMGALATGLAAAGCAQTAAPRDVSSARRVPIDFDDPAQNLRAFIKLTGDLDPQAQTVGWFGGTVFAVTTPDRPLMPLFGVEGFGVLRVATLANGRYRMFNRELAFYKDLKTGAYLDRWLNPFTNESVEVSPIHNRVVNAEIAPIMKMDFDGTMVEVPFRPPWEIMGGKAFSLFEVHTAFPSPMQPEQWPRESAGRTLRISEMFQRFTTLAELEDPGRTSCEHTGTWTRIGPWLPWMLQGQAPGHLFYRCFMDRTGTAERLPPALREHAERRYPDFFQAPGDETWGQPNDSSFSVYMAEHRPQPAAAAPE